MTIRTPCWGFHAESIPATADEVVGVAGQRWVRAGRRAWRPADEPDADRFHESWVLATYGPVRCPEVERLMAEREEMLAGQLRTEECWSWLPGPEHDQAGQEPLVFEDALMLMVAGWLAWTPKQRTAALAALRATEQQEMELTS